jgi:AraC family transcriptional regulator of adaptative response/methylated-DNA-[protein]-cysteine methyltransferase
VEPAPNEACDSPQASRDYHLVARAIRFIDEHRGEQPSLARVAEEVGLHEHHFQRLFQRWAGVSPKRFLQFLTKEHAKRLLSEGASGDRAARDVGLSGTGRLHDLMVTVEAATPGEIRRGYDGVALAWGVHDTRFGTCAIASSARGICGLAFLDDTDVTSWLESSFPRATLAHAPGATLALVRRIFEPSRGDASIPIVLRGTAFQLRVWQALLEVPPGTVSSYETLAAKVGAPRAARAVGSAVGQNKLAYVVPCHRVIRSIGAISGYAWGPPRKRAILASESARAVR